MKLTISVFTAHLSTFVRAAVFRQRQQHRDVTFRRHRHRRIGYIILRRNSMNTDLRQAANHIPSVMRLS